MIENNNVVIGPVITDDQTVSFVELCHCTEIAVEHLLSMIEVGLLEPINSHLSHIRWRFSSDSIMRVRTALRLQRDLDVNMAGAVLAIELLDELKELRHK